MLDALHSTSNGVFIRVLADDYWEPREGYAPIELLRGRLTVRHVEDQDGNVIDRSPIFDLDLLPHDWEA